MKDVARIVVVGSCNVDQVARAPQIPKPGETLVGSSFQIGFGGKGANQAVMAARLGAQVSMVGKVGRDTFGPSTIENFEANKVDAECVTYCEDAASGVAPIWVDERTGQNTILVIPGANERLGPRDVKAAAAKIREADCVLCQLETPAAAAIEAFEIARGAGVTTILNPAPASSFPPKLMSLTDILIPNEQELAFLVGRRASTREEVETAGRELLEQGVTQLIVTLGSSGSLYLSEEETRFVEAEKVNAVDTTGAGDAYIGSFAFFLASGLPVLECMRRASFVAGVSVKSEGTQTSFPAASALPKNLFSE